MVLIAFSPAMVDPWAGALMAGFSRSETFVCALVFELSTPQTLTDSRRAVAFTALPDCRPAAEGEGGAAGEGHRPGARAREERAEEARMAKGRGKGRGRARGVA